MSRLAVLSLVAVVVTYILVVLGGVVRATGSGLGCPDWPLCHGKLIPPLEFHILLEYYHRLVSLLVSGLVTALAVAGGVRLWRIRRHRGAALAFLLAMALLVLQVVLGAMAVILELPPLVVTGHLAVALAMMAALVVGAMLLTQSAGSPDGQTRVSAPKSFSWLILGAALATYVLILSGSYTVGSGASLACSSWPACLDRPSGDLAYLVGINMIHRVIASIAGAMIAATVVQTMRIPETSRTLKVAVNLAGVLLVLQVGVGAVGVASRWPASVEALHLALAAAVWSFLVAAATMSFAGGSIAGQREPIRTAPRPVGSSAAREGPSVGFGGRKGGADGNG